LLEGQSCSVTWDKLAGKQGGNLQRIGHPAFPLLEAQKFKMAVGYGTAFNLCWECHREFLALLGKFLKLEEYARFAELTTRPKYEEPSD
jgi:hypothetical protein